MNEKLNDVVKLMGRDSYEEFKIFVLQIMLYKFMYDNKSSSYNVKKSLTELSTSMKDENTKDLLIQAFDEADLSVTGKAAKEAFSDVFDPYILFGIEKNIVDEVIKAVSSIDVTEDVVTEFIEYCARNNGKCECTTTTQCISDLVAELVSINTSGGSIADFCCGSAGMIRSAGKKIEAENYTIMDISQRAVTQAKIRLIIAKVPFEKIHSYVADTITNNVTDKFDVQVSNPPFKMSWDGNQKLLTDERYHKYEVLPPKSTADMLFMENIIEHMSNHGKAAVICTGSPLIISNSEATIRKKIIDMNVLDAVFKLPAGCLFYTGIPIYVLIFEKVRKQKDVFFMDTSAFFQKERRNLTISKDGICSIANIYKSREQREDISYVISRDEIKKANSVLNTEAYIDRKKVERLLKNEKLVQLSDVALILYPRPVNKWKYVLNAAAAKYPLDYENLEEKKASDIRLQKGDIIFRMSMVDTMYLLDREPRKEIYASPRDIVIRPIHIQAEYLYLFIKSEVGQLTLSIVSPSMSGIFKRLTRTGLNQAKIPLPKKNSEEYRKVFAIENNLGVDISVYNALLASKGKHIESVTIEDVLNQELVENVKTCKTEVMQSFLTDDIKELNLCFGVKAYKATLVLAGSILEAILIDWMSEIKGEDYFKTDYMIEKTNKKHKKYYKRADLIDYIDEIKEIEKPDWMDGAEKAHAIRKNRNLVHAKLGIKSEKINEQTCRKVIDYLKDVIRSRGVSE